MFYIYGNFTTKYSLTLYITIECDYLVHFKTREKAPSTRCVEAIITRDTETSKGDVKFKFYIVLVHRTNYIRFS